MPLIFPAKNVTELQYSAASLREILIDIVSNRVLITVEYGNIVSNNFVVNKNIPVKVYTLDGQSWTKLAVAKPDALLSMYDNVKKLAWQALLDAGFEVGAIG